MAVEDRSLSEFPRALQVAEQALVMISNPDGLGGYDTNGAVLTEVGKALLNVQYTQQLGNVSVFDAIKNCRVLSGTTTPTANEGANGQLYVKYQTVSDVDTVIGMYFKKDGAWLEISLGGGGGSSYVELTQAEYDAMEQAGTLDPTVMYFITDGQSGGSSTLAGLSDVNLTSPTDGQLLRYNGTSGKWENAGVDSLGSTSLNTTNKTVVGAINELNSDKADKGVSNIVNDVIDVPMNTNAFINHRSISNLIIVTAVFNTNSATSSNTQLAHLNGVSQIGQVYASSVGSSGTGGRFKMQNGIIINEFAMPAGEYFSLTFVSFI